jgi:hypothetical protein
VNPDDWHNPVTITAKEYHILLKESFFLDCLEACGVDNWVGYDDAIERLNKEYPDEEN